MLLRSRTWPPLILCVKCDSAHSSAHGPSNLAFQNLDALAVFVALCRRQRRVPSRVNGRDADLGVQQIPDASEVRLNVASINLPHQ